MPKNIFSKMVTNSKFLVTVLVLAGAFAGLLMQDSQRTAAFLSTKLKDIGMGVGTDRWQPPLAPQVLGYNTENQTSLTCESFTQESQVSLQWEQPEEDPANVKHYFIGTTEQAYLYEVDKNVNEQMVDLVEGANHYQVIAVDQRGEESEPSPLCVITKDTTQPVVSITTPQADVVSGGLVTITAQVSDENLASAVISVLDSEGQVVAEGGEVTESETGSQISLEWDSGELPSGAYALQVVATDQVGLQSASTKQITLDTEVPTVSLAMNLPVVNDDSLVPNGGFESGTDAWTWQGSYTISGLNQAQATPQQGLLSAVLGDTNVANSVSMVSQDLNNQEQPVERIGFWYYLDPTQGVAQDEGMMVFVGEDLVFEDWLHDNQAVWKYIQLDISNAQDKSITVAYYHDQDQATGGKLYLDGFVTNQSLAIADITFNLQVGDETSAVTGYAQYQISGETFQQTTTNQVAFNISEVPDDQVISYWAEDAAGNVSDTFQLMVPQLTQVATEQIDNDVPTPADDQQSQATDSAQLNNQVEVAIEDKGEYRFDLKINNLETQTSGEYVVVYTHSQNPEEDGIQEALQGTFQVAENETEVVVADLYFGTCSSTVGVQCAAHQNTRDITVIVTVEVDGQLIEYQFQHQGIWTTQVIENESDDAAV